MTHKITWLGFNGFIINTSQNKRILIDPWVKNNPIFPDIDHHTLLQCDYILLTHAHRDHAEDAIWLGQQSGAPIIAGWELCQLLQERGIEKVLPINKGGTRTISDIKVTAVHADHSGAYVENGRILYGGEPMGYVICLEDGYTLYHAGDTNVFGDMSLISELYTPHIALLPIGDVLTMGPKEAAKAAELLNIKDIIPMHYGFSFLTGTPAELRKLVKEDVMVHELKSGESLEFGYKSKSN